MEKDVCEIKFTETDEGIRIEAKGEGIKVCLEACQKGNFSCCGIAKGQ